MSQTQISSEYDYEIKLILVGTQAVGKTSILGRYADDKFEDGYLPTLGVDFKFKIFPLIVQGVEKQIKLQIWDTAGQERFKSMTSMFYKNAHGVMMVYDCTNKESFEEVQDYWDVQMSEEFEDKGPIVKMVVGNKCELTESKEVNGLDARRYSQHSDFLFAEVSAYTNENISEAFDQLVLEIIKNNPNINKSLRSSQNIKIDENRKKREKCC